MTASILHTRELTTIEEILPYIRQKIGLVHIKLPHTHITGLICDVRERVAGEWEVQVSLLEVRYWIAWRELEGVAAVTTTEGANEPAAPASSAESALVLQPCDVVLDAIYAFVDEMMHEGQWIALDAFCANWSFHVGLDRTLAILTATLPGKSRLPQREQLLYRAKRHFDLDVFSGL